MEGRYALITVLRSRATDVAWRRWYPRPRFSGRCVLDNLALRKCLLDHELTRLAVIAFAKTLAEQQRSRVMNQRGTATDHDAIMFGRKRRKTCIAKQLA